MNKNNYHLKEIKNLFRLVNRKRMERDKLNYLLCQVVSEKFFKAQKKTPSYKEGVF